MKTEKELKKYYDEVAGRAHLSKAGEVSSDTIRETLLALMSPYRRSLVLDAGVGPYPVYLEHFAEKGARTVGVDLAHRFCQMAKDRASAFPFAAVTSSAASLPFKDDSFDACISSETLEHVPDDAKAIAELARVLKPGGLLFLSVPCKYSLVAVYLWAMTRLRGEKWRPNVAHIREYRYSELAGRLSEHFKIRRFATAPFVNTPFRRQPVENFMNLLIKLPFLRRFGLSLCFVLESKKEG